MRHILKKITFSILVFSRLFANGPTDKEIFGDTLERSAPGNFQIIKGEPKEWVDKDKIETNQGFSSNDEALEHAIGDNLILQYGKIEPGNIIVGFYGFYGIYRAEKTNLSLVVDSDGKEFFVTDGRFLLKCSVKSGDEDKYDFVIELTDKNSPGIAKVDTSIILEDKHPQLLLRHDSNSGSGEFVDYIFWAYRI